MNYVVGTFQVQPSGFVGQEIIDPDGTVIAWTTNAWVAQVICMLLTEHEELLAGPQFVEGSPYG